MLAVPESTTGGNSDARPTVADARSRVALDIVPFEPWHFSLLTLQPEQAWIELTQEYAEGLQYSGPCFTAFAGISVVACAGVIEKWKGSALVWSLLSEDMKLYRFGMHRAVKRFLNTYTVERLECTVDPTSVHAVNWARSLGFKYESTMPKHAPNGATMDMYVRMQ